MTEPLLELFARCVVRVDVDGAFRGTGFLVAPGEVLTCAHVVHGGGAVTVGDGWAAEPTTPLLAPDDPAARFYPQPDAVLLRVPDAPPGHPCVRLEDAAPAPEDALQLSAFTQGEYVRGAVVRSGASLHLEALFELDGCPLYKLREGQVVGGYSGGPLLNRSTGGVCALVDSTRAEKAPLGGFGVPVAAIAGLDEGLLARNAAFHDADTRWRDAHEAQRVAEDERAGLRDLLPLLPPVVALPRNDVAPSELLRPRHAVVPFVPRGDLLDHLMTWREREGPLSVLVLTGAGGFGKTRTAVEACRGAEAAGWTAGPLDADSTDGLRELVTWRGRTLVAVDYAETRPELVTTLLGRLLRRRNAAPVRVLLVVRQGGTRQNLVELFATGDARDDIARLLVEAELVGLGHGERELDRRELFAAAGREFAPILGGGAPPVPDLYAEHFERPLFVLAAALLAVTDPALAVGELSADELMAQVLDRHESAYWERADTRRALHLDPADRRTAVALAALCGLGDDEADERLVRLVPALRDTSAERVRHVLRWLRELYGPAGVLEPDILGEVLVARTVGGAPGLVGAVLDAATDAQLARALVVLSRVAGRSEDARVAARDALDERLPALVARVVANADADLTATLQLAVGAIQPAAGAVRAQYNVPVRSAALGRLAIEIGALAVDGLSRAAEENPRQFGPLLAAALTLLSTTFIYVGRPGEGLAPITEAVTYYRAVVDTDPTRFLPDLAGCLNNQSELFAEAGRPTEGLAPIAEAVIHYRSLADMDPTRYLPDLAMSLNNQSNRFAQAGRPAEGLALITES